MKVATPIARIIVLLRDRTGHDFSQYKRSTVSRRIERRMAAQQIETLDGYARFCSRTPAELDALFRDLLIGVTSFFRDPEAFEALEAEVIPRLFSAKPAGSEIRVWSAGCSSGEEAYSLAMLLRERADALGQGHVVRVFGTDIDAEAIDRARAGRYPVAIAADVPAERLAHYFTVEPGDTGYRVCKTVRSQLVFSEHDLIKNPPFSRVDLVSCRNVLIYMGAELQQAILPLFHHALNPDGFLFLGTSETVTASGALFSPLDRKAKIYARTSARAGLAPLATPVDVRDATIAARPPSAGKAKLPARPPLRELIEQALLQQVELAAALVTGTGDIHYLHGRTGRYFEPAPGAAGTSNLVRMAREGLRDELAAALREAVGASGIVLRPGLRVRTNGDFTVANLAIRRVAAGDDAAVEPPLYLVTLQEASPRFPDPRQEVAAVRAGDGAADPGAEVDARIAALEWEIRARDERLRIAAEQMDSSVEELSSSNEELQASNEELETATEELQSVNEELLTVNTELRSNVDALSVANRDMSNLLTGTHTISVDVDLRVLRFSPGATAVVNLIPTDVGRPIGHVASNLVGYDTLTADVQAVLRTLVPIVVDVQTVSGAWYTMRIQPYRTLENAIVGAVLTFSDITEAQQLREALRGANDLLRLAVVVRDSSDAITVQAMDGRILAWNGGATKLYGWSEAQALGMNTRDRIPEALRGVEIARVHGLSRSEILKPYLTQRMTRDGEVVGVTMVASALVDEAGNVYAIATTERRGSGPGSIDGATP